MRDYDTIVIGAGQAGLAAGHYLSQAGARFVLLDAATAVGESWRRRWDSLRLFTPARYNSLPGLPFPGAPTDLPGKDEVAAYLETYAKHYRLPLALGSPVSRLEHRPSGFVVTTRERTLFAPTVIVATGAYHEPFIPRVAEQLSPAIVQRHSSQYRNPSQLPAGDVLVVGAGNSGAQIALELSATRRVWLSGPDTGTVPRRLLGRDIYDWLWPTVMQPTARSWMGRRLMGGRLFSGDPLVGMSVSELESPALTRVGRTTGAHEGRPLVEGRGALDVAAVVWCTGFRPRFDWIAEPILRADGYPDHVRGLSSTVPGLAFLGLRYQSRLNSSLLGGVGRDARFVVGALRGARRHAA